MLRVDMELNTGKNNSCLYAGQILFINLVNNRFVNVVTLWSFDIMCMNFQILEVCTSSDYAHT